MRCLNCRLDGIDLTAQVCPQCGVHLPTLMRDLLVPGTFLDGGKYRIDYALGQGGFGITYRAIDLNLERQVAIKEFYPQAYVQRQSNTGHITISHADAGNYERWLGRFEREGRILARLNHPGIVKVHALFKEKETGYLVMELLEGKTLRDELDAQPGKKLPPERVEAMAAAIVSALETVHREGVYHLDLKPDNVMLTRDGRIVLVDFGAARQDLSQDPKQKSSTRALTPQYAPLELLSGDPVGPESDLFELGMILHEALTGECPPTVMARFSKELWQPTVVSDPWRELLTQALRLERRNRPNSVAQWWQAYAQLSQPFQPAIDKPPMAKPPITAPTLISVPPPDPEPIAHTPPAATASQAPAPEPPVTDPLHPETQIELIGETPAPNPTQPTQATQIPPQLLRQQDPLPPSDAPPQPITIPPAAAANPAANTAVTRISLSQQPTQLQQPATGTPAPPPRRPHPWGVSRRTLILGGLGTVGLGATVLWNWLNRTSPTHPVSTTSEPTTSAPSTSLDSPALFPFETVTVNAQGQVSQRVQKQARYFTEDLGNGILLEMVEIPAGTFLMGSPVDEPKRRGDEAPQHRPTLRRFFMGKFPITQAQWQQVMGNNPAKNLGERHPVDNIAWNDAQEFCKKLSQQTGRRYRLPSEAEWEYACRAGKTTTFSFGPTLNSELANYDASQVYRDEAPGKNRRHSSPVGRFPANAFGLYDMHGNVWEWCEDVWHKSYAGAPNDGSAWISEGDAPVRRILRGGSWNSGPENCRAAIRNTLNQEDRFDIHGLRVVCSG